MSALMTRDFAQSKDNDTLFTLAENDVVVRLLAVRDAWSIYKKMPENMIQTCRIFARAHGKTSRMTYAE